METSITSWRFMPSKTTTIKCSHLNAIDSTPAVLTCLKRDPVAMYRLHFSGVINVPIEQLFTVIITGELTNSPWHLYQKCFIVSLHIDDFTFITHAQKRKSESL